jgi:DNA-binding transcriptional MerR regulator
MPPPRAPLIAYKTIGEVAILLDLPQHILRFWETRFDEIQPLRKGSGSRARRLYRHEDIALLNGIRFLMHAEGYTIRGIQRLLKKHGVQHVRDVVSTN